MSEEEAQYAAGPTPPATLTPELIADIRRRAERRDGRGWEYTTVAVEAVYALCDAAEGTEASRLRGHIRQAIREIEFGWHVGEDGPTGPNFDTRNVERGLTLLRQALDGPGRQDAAEEPRRDPLRRELDDALPFVRGLRHELGEMRTVVKNFVLERDRLRQAMRRAYNFVAPELEGPPKPYPQSPGHNAATILRAALSSTDDPVAASPSPGQLGPPA